MPVNWRVAAMIFAACSGRAVAQQAADPIAIDVHIGDRDAPRSLVQSGATTYTFSPNALGMVAQGSAAPLNEVLLRAPGVAEDSFGQIHLRGEHANLQYRLNGVQLPEGLSAFGQAIESRFARGLSLITGALPAQFGFQTAGVINIRTKNGTDDPGGEISVYGGAWHWLQPSLSYGGSSGSADWFVTGDALHDDRGIENPTARFAAIHDTTVLISTEI